MSSSSGEKYGYTFTWLIENFQFSDTLQYFDSKEIRSPLFTTENIEKTSWFLSIRLNSVNDDEFRCFLVRYIKDEGTDIIRLQWKLKVTSTNNLLHSRKDDLVIDAFQKGFLRRGCDLYNITKSICQVPLITLQCQMTKYLSVEQPVPNFSSIRSTIQEFSWVPQSLLEIKLLPGFQGVQYEISLHVSNGNISLRIRRSDHNNLVVCYIQCGLSLFFGLEEYVLKTNEKDRFLKPFNIHDTLDMPTILKTKKFFGSKFPKSIEIKGVFIISTLIKTNCSTPERKNKNIADMNLVCKLDTCDTLREDQLRMYENRIHSDVKLQIGTDLFPAHKCILSSRSPVFSAMFDQDMIENQTGEVNITDMDSNTLKLLLKYMYTCLVDELYYESALKLLIAAEKYQVLSLREKCSNYLMANLSDENVCEVLATADMIAHPDLKISAMKYVKAHANKVLVSDDWKNIVAENINLASEILSKISIDVAASRS